MVIFRHGGLLRHLDLLYAALLYRAPYGMLYSQYGSRQNRSRHACQLQNSHYDAFYRDSGLLCHGDFLGHAALL